MNLARHAGVLWRFRGVTAAGVLLGIVLAVLASYEVSTSGLERRGTPTYTSQSQLLVTQTGFPEGRVVLPPVPAPERVTEPRTGGQERQRLAFADPSRFMALADLYTKLITSDEVRRRIPSRPKPAQLVASPLPAVSGAPVLPIIQLDTIAASADAAQTLNINTIEALRGLLAERQIMNGIAPPQRVQISVLNKPGRGVVTSGPSSMASLLAFLLCVIGTIAVTHMLENLRSRRRPTDFDDLDAWVDAGDASRSGRGSDDPLEAVFEDGNWRAPASRSGRVK